jgi:DEAD/DEAH box helicase domain-containing protein
MFISVLVQNPPPQTEQGVAPPLMNLFQQYHSEVSAIKHPVFPFEHQAQVFRLVGEENQEAYLVAGTASGKTLAIAVPMFYKLRTKQIRRVLLMYPTIALMEDQRRVMDTLAKITNVETGMIQGGMTRSALISALNKQVILATPDAIYWFFQKNVKYSGLLVYGLALVDEFVLDEAHLFNGLMLRNFQHLWQRIKQFGNYIGKNPHLHILTATPTAELQQLNNAVPIHGKSKCNDVQVEFRTRQGYDKLAEQFASLVNESLDAGYRKVLVVCNSARMAHQLFEKFKVKDTSTIPVEHRFRFGKVNLGELIEWFGKTDIKKELVDRLCTTLLSQDDLVLGDVPSGKTIELPLQEVVAKATETLERQCWRVKRASREKIQQPGETWESLLKNRPLPCGIIAAIRSQLDRAADMEQQQAVVDEWLTSTLESLSNISTDPIPCKAREFASLTNAFVSAGIGEHLAALLTKNLVLTMKVDPQQIPTHTSSQRPVYLRWLDWVIGKEHGEQLREAVMQGLRSGELEAECRHIGLWKGSNVPVILYSGSMAKQARRGLINVFADLDRAVLISTSAVEVGVDFDADLLITEECEGNSFLQRFGRVGRHGQGSKVIVLVGGEVYGKFSEMNNTEKTREEFSQLVVNAFPRRNYASGSELVDANHYLVNERLGRIGAWLNASADSRVKSLADKLRAADLKLGYGLRETMPQISLRDGVTKDPFYLLRYLDDQVLRPSDSPFEVARANAWFTELLYSRRRFDVTVDLEKTLGASQHLFIWTGQQFEIWPDRPMRGAGKVYLEGMMRHFSQTGGWNKWDQRNFLLAYGDVYLAWLERELEAPPPDAVKDSEGNPLFIPEQTYLLLWGWNDRDSTRELLEGAKVSDWEELVYDWDGVRSGLAKAMVILEKTTGACFAAYKDLVDYVGRQIQK